MKGASASVVAIGAAFLVAFAVAKMVGPPPPQGAAVVRPDAGPTNPPALVSPMHAPLGSTERATPPGIVAQGDVRAAPWAPGIRLSGTTTDGRWPEWRAHIEDLTNEDVRAYATGDLLPHGSLLVGVSTGTAHVLVSDRVIIEMFDDGTLITWEDFETAARASAGPQKVSGPDPAFVEAVEEAIDGLRSEDPAIVQAAIDALVDAGDPVVDQLVFEAESLYPAAYATYSVPSGGDKRVVPKVQGDLIIAILERITGETFGDTTDAEFVERRRIVERWRRWWGD